MNTFTLQHLNQKIKKVNARFPLVMAVILIWSSSLIINVWLQYQGDLVYINFKFLLDFIIRLTALLIPLLFIRSLCMNNYSKKSARIATNIGCILGILFYSLDTFFWKVDISSHIKINQEFIIILMILIVGIPIIPFMNNSARGVWVVSNILFTKLLKVMSLSLIFLLGLNLLFLIFDYVTHLKIDFWVYQLGFILIACCLAPLYFLSEIPIFNQAYKNDLPYPKFYIVFSTGYLLPVSVITIISIYAVIINYLVQGSMLPMEIQIFFVIIATIVIWLMFQLELVSVNFKKKYVFLFLKYIYLSILPLAIICLTQVIHYLTKNGITEFWYLIGMYLIWVLGICIYFIVSKKRDIRVIPISLCIGLSLLLIKPLKPFNISVTSQYRHVLLELKRLDRINNDNKFLFTYSNTLNSEQVMAVKDKLYFLNKHDSLSLLKKHYPYPIDDQALTMKRLITDLGLSN